jgi:type I restriction enzyme S subunit
VNPSEWRYDKARRFLVTHKQGYYTTESYVDDGVKLLRITDLIGNGNVSFRDCPKVPDVQDLKPYLLSKGDFVFARTGGAGTFGLVENIDEDVVFASYLIRFRYNKFIYPRFLKYHFQSSDFYHSIVKNIHGGVNQNIHAEDIKDQNIFVPPLEIQKQIADFLDKETTRIDTLITKKQKQIELLNEKRQAIITQSVTKGLDENVKMKDSGVEWIGEIPEHWKVVKIRHLTLVKRGASPRPIDDPKYFDDDGEFSWVRISDVTASLKYLENTTQSLSNLGSSLSVKLHPGKLFLSIAGSVGKPMISKIKMLYP